MASRSPVTSRVFAKRQFQRSLWVFGIVLVMAGFGLFTYYYVRFSREIDLRLSGAVFENVSTVLASPYPIRLGDPGSVSDIAARLRKAHYSEPASGSRVGTYQTSGNRIRIDPGPGSYFVGGGIQEGPATIEFRDGQVASITALDLDHPGPLDVYWLEPEVVTTLFDESRTKQRLIRYQDLPKDVVNAVLAAEDHRFFSHHGVSLWRIMGAAVRDIRVDERAQGGSTLTMQLARDFFLTRRKAFRRKIEEIFLALLLEQRLTKQQIFELYANQVYLGQRGSFSIRGLGEGSDAYFNKDVSSLTLPEAALLAGIIRGPNLDSPYRYPARAVERRNYVVHRMQEDGFITPAEAAQAEKAPLHVAPQNAEGSQAPYFVDMVRDQLLSQFSERDLVSQSYRIYTTLDPDVQRAASDGVRSGMAELDQMMKKARHRNSPPLDPNQPQVALVALDPHSGEVRALVGGRNYAVSQLDHVVAKRQPGSSFKPFVYAAALNSGVDGSQPLVTPATILRDEPTTFEFDGNFYEPGNYKQEYHGAVTLREALMHSLNAATVSLAQMIGYEKVKDLAIAAGINKDMLATPAIALGAYVATPLEIAGAYTMFANSGECVSPSIIREVRDSTGRVIYRPSPTRRPVLDPRVAYLMDSLMESVIISGTGAGVRSRGFTLPAAGKTGSSHDGWFAGFTTNLLAVVWVGYDDDRDIHLSGASTALPVWADFMKEATKERPYRNATEFSVPPGIVTTMIDVHTDPGKPDDSILSRSEFFIQGTEPGAQLAPGVAAGVVSAPAQPAAPLPNPPPAAGPGHSSAVGGPLPAPGGNPPVTLASNTAGPLPPHKKGAFKRFVGLLKGGGDKAPPPQPVSKSPPGHL